MNNTNFSEKLITLFNLWEKNGITYCNWKSTIHLDATFKGNTDADVLVDINVAQKAIQMAIDSSFIILQSVDLRKYPSVFDFVCYDEKIEKWIHLHFHTKIICGDRWVKAYHLHFEIGILKSRIWNKSYNTWVIHPYFELAILFYRMNAKFRNNWLKDNKIIEEIKNITENIDDFSFIDDFNFLNDKCNIILKDIFNTHLIHSNKNSLLQKEFNPSKFLRFNTIKFRLLSKRRFLYRLYIEFRRRKLTNYSEGRRVLPFGGYTVAFIGIDGSGKTTGIKRVTNIFAQQINVANVFLGAGKSGASLIRKIIMALFGFKASFKSHQEIRKSSLQITSGSSNKLNQIKKPPLYYLLWQYLVIIDREKALSKIRKSVANGKIVLIDRWLQTDVKGGLDGPRLWKWTAADGFLGKIARREERLYSDIKYIHLNQVIILNISPEKSMERKPGELDMNIACDAIDKLKQINWSKSTIVSNINADNDADNVKKQIVEQIWEGLSNYVQ